MEQESPPCAPLVLLKRSLAERFGKSEDASTDGFDDRLWPVVRASVGVTTTEHQLMDLLACVSQAHRNGTFALVLDLRRAPPLTPGWRHLLAAARMADHERFPDVLQAEAFVVADDEQRRAVLAVGWLAEERVPRRTFIDSGAAVAWCMEVLIASGAAGAPEVFSGRR